jgi:hypothetical protein
MLGRLLLLTSLVSTSALADHLPERLLANGKPEVVLAGVDLERAGIDDVIRLYGPPSRKLKFLNNPAWTGYIWEARRAKLEIGINSGPNGDRITDVYVQGTDRGPMGTTGRGLKLGDELTELKRLYGDHFQVENLSTGLVSNRREFTGVANSHRVRIQWRSIEFTLTAGFTETGRIAALWLLSPECYPAECH